MAIIGYVYDRNSVLIGQLFWVVGFQCTIKLNEICTGELSISNESLQDALILLKENNRITVTLSDDDGSEQELISWYMRGVEASLTATVIKIEDLTSMFDDKIIYSQISFSWTITQLLQNILDAMNQREPTGITLNCDVTEVVSKEYPRGETIGNILKDLRQNTYEYCVRNNVLIFKSTIGIDRSGLGNDYRELTWDIDSPLDRTIRDAKLVMDIKQMCNACLGKDSTNLILAEDIASIGEFGRIERSITNSGNIQEAVNNYVQERKDSIREFDISPNIADFFFCDIGDLVRVHINSGNDIMFYDWPLMVIEKSYTAGEMPKITFKLAKNKVKSMELNEKIREINRRVQKLELK